MTSMRWTLICLFSLLPSILAGCSSSSSLERLNGAQLGSIKSEKRSVADFHAVSLAGAFDGNIVSGKPQQIKITGPAKLLPLLSTEVANGVLFVHYNRSDMINKPGVKLEITVPALTRVDVEGANKVKVSAIKAPRFEIQTSGSGKLLASGKTQELSIQATGACEIDTKHLQADKVNVNSTGASAVTVFAGAKLNANVFGAGSLDYLGSPKEVHTQIAGAASVKNLGKTM